MFKKLSKAQFDALTEDQQAYYLEQKATNDAEELQKKIDAASKTAVDAATEELKTENESLKTQISEVKVQMDERDVKVEAAMAEMSRIKTRENSGRAKSIGVEIYDALNTEKGKQALKDARDKKAASLELDAAFKAPGVMGVPTGTTQQEWVAPVGIPHEQMQARMIIPVFNTSRDTIKYVQFTKGQGSIGSVAAGTEKPQIDYVTTPKTANVVKIAGWLTVQDEFLDDIDGAPEFLATELPQAYMDEETRQSFKGDGSGAPVEELEGLYSIWAQDLLLPMGTVTDASNNWDKIIAGLTQTRRNLRPGDAIWTSPEDYMELLINKGNTDEYTYPIVSDLNGTLRMAGIPIYFHNVFEPGEGLAGNFRRGVAMFQRKGITLRTSNQHDKNFTSNLVTFLIEARVAQPCYFPESFVRIDFYRTT